MNQLKLSDVISAVDQQQQGKGLKHAIKNSLKRNIISSTSQEQSYQVKVTHHNFKSRDLHLLFMHLYSKDQMSSSDRNLIRRLMLMIFPESLISSGGKKLVHFTNYASYKKGQQITNFNQFFLVLKGKIEIKYENTSLVVEDGGYFGHIWLLGNETYFNKQITVLAKTSVLTIDRKTFQNYLKPYFDTMFQRKMNSVPEFLKRQLEKSEEIQLYERMDKVTFPVGSKVFGKGDKVQNLIFIAEGGTNKVQTSTKLGEGHSKIIGFPEYIKGKKVFEHNYFCLEPIIGYSIPIQIYKKIISEDKLFPLYSSFCKDFSTMLENSQKNQQVPKQKNFLRVRKVKLPIKQRLKTTPSKGSTLLTKEQENQANFVFIKPNVDKKLLRSINRSQLLHDKSELSITKIQNQLSYFSYFK